MSEEPITFRRIYQSSDYSQSFLTVANILENQRLYIRNLEERIKKLEEIKKV